MTAASSYIALVCALCVGLQQPQTHSFRLYHDYTERRAGVNGYANVVRTGSVASNPSATILDTGEQLKVLEMSGAEMIASTRGRRRAVESQAARWA